MSKGSSPDIEPIDVITQLDIEMFLDLDDDDDGDDGLNGEDDTGIKELSKLEAFMVALQQAQAIATAASRFSIVMSLMSPPLFLPSQRPDQTWCYN
jgi:hypothetical protein